MYDNIKASLDNPPRVAKRPFTCEDGDRRASIASSPSCRRASGGEEGCGASPHQIICKQADLDSAEKEAQQEESSCHYYDTLSAGLRAAQKIAGNAVLCSTPDPLRVGDGASEAAADSGREGGARPPARDARRRRRHDVPRAVRAADQGAGGTAAGAARAAKGAGWGRSRGVRGVSSWRGPL